MTAIAFDTLAYSRTLQDAGMPVEQADALARAQKAAIDEMAEAKELARKDDIQGLRLEMKAMEMRLLKWQIGLAVAIIAIMAKGFGWLGF